ncbi:hypothetical protein GCM10009411_02780 [Shewanella litoralis]|uniref:DUF2975 domain-containing protein n=2 Tax=Shewanella litoralis TaxID=2282700 RepID=A0ABQ2R219_9GAMM|nr:hypothetical protein GCM10009411_02780 [Shewanella litoralis]
MSTKNNYVNVKLTLANLRNVMDRIVSLSKWIKLLIVFLALLQASSYCGTMVFGEFQAGEYVLTIDWWGWFSSYLAVDFGSPWQAIVQSLYDAGFHPGFILGSVEILPYLFIYYFLYQLFTLYQQGQVFTPGNFRCLSNIALVFLAWILLSLFYPMIIAFSLHFSGTSSAVPVYFSLGSQELKYALFGMIFYCVAWVMQHATELQQEAELTI